MYLLCIFLVIDSTLVRFWRFCLLNKLFTYIEKEKVNNISVLSEQNYLPKQAYNDFHI